MPYLCSHGVPLKVFRIVAKRYRLESESAAVPVCGVLPDGRSSSSRIWSRRSGRAGGPEDRADFQDIGTRDEVVSTQIAPLRVRWVRSLAAEDSGCAEALEKILSVNQPIVVEVRRRRINSLVVACDRGGARLVRIRPDE